VEIELDLDDRSEMIRVERGTILCRQPLWLAELQE
jgi:hypothetical protein